MLDSGFGASMDGFMPSMERLVFQWKTSYLPKLAVCLGKSHPRILRLQYLGETAFGLPKFRLDL